MKLPSAGNLLTAEMRRQRERKDGYMFNSIRRRAEEKKLLRLGRILNIAWTKS